MYKNITHLFVGLVVAFGSLWLSISTAFAGPATGGGAAINVTEYTDGDFSSLFERIGDSFVGAPGLISAAAYLTAMILAVSAILKLKEAFDSPGNVSMREPIGRALIAGALFAMPTVIDTVTATIGTQDGSIGVRSLALGADLLGHLSSATGAEACDAIRAARVANAALGALGDGDLLGAIGTGVGSYMFGGSVGEVICYATHSFRGLAPLISVILYISGLFLVFWGLLQLKEHLISPDRTPVSGPLKKLLVAGAFFAFPSLLDVVANTFGGDGNGVAAIDPSVQLACASGGVGNILNAVGSLLDSFSGDGGGGASSKGGGLDCMMVKLVTDLWSPVQMAVSIFGYLAGIILIALALRRMLDSMDKGVRSPVGLGTLGMFAIGGALLSFDQIIRALTVSIFPDVFSTMGVPTLKLYGSLAYAPGLSEGAAKSVNSVISAVFMFSFLVGIISVMRGLFMLKEVSNGGNASLMAAFTHVIGGGLAVNLGPVVNAVQHTLGLSNIGIKVCEGLLC